MSYLNKYSFIVVTLSWIVSKVFVVLVLPSFYFLYFSTGLQDDRIDLSHPVHADNCLLQADGACHRQFPAYVQRDYRYSMSLSYKTLPSAVKKWPDKRYREDTIL